MSLVTSWQTFSWRFSEKRLKNWPKGMLSWRLKKKKKLVSLARDRGRSTETNLVTDNCKISLCTLGWHVEKVVSFMELARQGAGKKYCKLFTSCTEKFKRPISLLMLKNPKTMKGLGIWLKKTLIHEHLFSRKSSVKTKEDTCMAQRSGQHIHMFQ